MADGKARRFDRQRIRGHGVIVLEWSPSCLWKREESDHDELCRFGVTGTHTFGVTRTHTF